MSNNKNCSGKLIFFDDFFRKFTVILDVEDWPKKSEIVFNAIFVISGVLASLGKTFIKFGWPSEKLTLMNPKNFKDKDNKTKRLSDSKAVKIWLTC